MNEVIPIKWKRYSLHLLDQRILPHKVKYLKIDNAEGVRKAIADMIVRGAPAIGITAGFGIALWASKYKGSSILNFRNDFEHVAKRISSARPTAINLFWAIDRMRCVVNNAGSVKNGIREIVLEAEKIFQEDLEKNKKIGSIGETLIKNGSNILTHCNAGALATGGYGTALGVILTAFRNGKKLKVFADETRPYLQGARLTAWELLNYGIDVTVISDNSAGWLMNMGMIDMVIVGADRIASNGDTANKIGTYSLSVLAKENKIPFYVAAPLSTFDKNIKKGDDIPIEQRDEKEVHFIMGRRITPLRVKALNYSFDITPAKNITGIITEKGIIYPPYRKSILAENFK